MPISSVSVAVAAAGEGMTMNMRVQVFVPMLAGLLAMSAPLSAHHGDAAYAATPKEMKGCVVTEFSWMNPHSLIKFDYKTATGELQHWTMEIGSPPSMALLGWSRTTLRAGDVITAYVYQAKSGAPVGRTNKVILADGTVLADRDDSTPSRYGTEAPK
ncbi:MAG TPA: DUF6152 family protein [Vicinamibacterales bacterium]|jgi:hypothetical protein|nr:DUF6152 family protein [Vicinamibacterales bacterium]